MRWWSSATPLDLLRSEDLPPGLNGRSKQRRQQVRHGFQEPFAERPPLPLLVGDWLGMAKVFFEALRSPSANAAFRTLRLASSFRRNDRLSRLEEPIDAQSSIDDQQLRCGTSWAGIRRFPRRP